MPRTLRKLAAVLLCLATTIGCTSASAPQAAPAPSSPPQATAAQAPPAPAASPKAPPASGAPAPAQAAAEPRPAVVPGGARNAVPAEPIGLAALIREPQSELARAVERWSIDARRLQRLYPVDSSEALRARLERFHREWLAELGALDWSGLSRPARVDALALRTWIERALADMLRAREVDARIAGLVGFAAPVADLAEACARIEPVDARAAAGVLEALAQGATRLQEELAEKRKADAAAVDRFDAWRAAARVDELARALRNWFEFYDGYDPLFTWWCRAPYDAARDALSAYAKFLREKLAQVGSGEDDIVGDPIGSAALARALEQEWIPYSAEELVALAEREFAACEARMRQAASDMGCGDDWKLALERVKGASVPPGAQPELVRDLTLEAIAFLRERQLISVPALAAETWRMDMLSPEEQRQNPFFLGGEAISVAYPTSAMSHEEKRMSMRGNNPHFARAVAHHEVIPGHNLQGFSGERWNRHRRVFSTPFWTEGWALYWELLLWDKGFAATPEDRVGMLFWRMHRCARIVFSLKFHLGEMDAKQCIEFLVQRVGHERANAAAEVRRSFAGDYGPLYQAGYLLGGMQLMALRRERVDSGRMGEREFHDAVIRAGSLPIELVRALLAEEELRPDARTSWRFAD